jgi:hypothetical protein
LPKATPPATAATAAPPARTGLAARCTAPPMELLADPPEPPRRAVPFDFDVAELPLLVRLADWAELRLARLRD